VIGTVNHVGDSAGLRPSLLLAHAPALGSFRFFLSAPALSTPLTWRHFYARFPSPGSRFSTRFVEWVVRPRCPPHHPPRLLLLFAVQSIKAMAMSLLNGTYVAPRAREVSPAARNVVVASRILSAEFAVFVSISRGSGFLHTPKLASLEEWRVLRSWRAGYCRRCL